jgi:predicted dehydrogenase
VSQLRVGVIGYGYWGPNVVRNLYALEACEVAALSEKNPAALQKAGRLYPGLRLTTDASEVLTSPGIDAVAVVTPVWTHYELARTALENGKHVFVEKPLHRPCSRPRTRGAGGARTCGSW